MRKILITIIALTPICLFAERAMELDERYGRRGYEAPEYAKNIQVQEALRNENPNAYAHRYIIDEKGFSPLGISKLGDTEKLRVLESTLNQQKRK